MDEKQVKTEQAQVSDPVYDKVVADCYAELRDKILERNPTADLLRVRTAFDFAEQAHRGQKRRDGMPYLTHVVAAAVITAELGLDEDSIVSALLHDVLEDTPTSHADIAKLFGPTVADIVEGVT